MSDNVSKLFPEEEATSRTSSKACQPSWMSHWKIKTSEVAPSISESSPVCNKGKMVAFGGKSDASPTALNMTNGFSRYGKGMIKDSNELLLKMVTETKKQGQFLSETTDHEFGDNNLSLALALGRVETSKDLNLPHENLLRSNKTHLMSRLIEENKGVTMSKTYTQKNANSALCLMPPLGSEKEDVSKPVVVFERHFSNDNFTSVGKDNCRYKKYSSLLVHETNTKNDLSDELTHDGHQNFHAFFGKEQPKTLPGDQSRLQDNVPYSVSNVETMRICTMVDSMEKSPSGYHKISQRAHHVVFTKETCANLPGDCEEEKTFRPFNVSLSHGIASTRPSGVMIQPLWTSTDSEEKENTGNSSVFKAGSRKEASVEADSMQENAPQSRYNNLPDRASSPLRKDNTMEENSSPAAKDSITEKTIRPLLEIPDINEQLPGHQPAASSTDEGAPSTSRVHSLNAKHLFSNKKRALTHSSNGSQEHSVSPEASNGFPEPGNRWIKRLKPNSSDSFGVGTKTLDGEGSSHQKFNMFFNRIMKNSRESLDPELYNHYSADQKELEQITESEVSKKREKNTTNGCAWIQRWCQNSVSQPKNPEEPLVICEPHSLKFGQEEVAKKQFPSIGALALMGKAMNGYRSCEFSKRGSVVVWNTREF